MLEEEENVLQENTERQSLLLVKVKLTILLKKVHFRGVLWPKTCPRDMLTLGEIFFDLPFNNLKDHQR